MSTSFRVLLIEDSAGDAFHVKRLLKTPPANYDVVHAATLASAQIALQHETALAAILLDLNLEDSRGIDTLVGISEYAPLLPIIVLTGVEDIEMAKTAVRRGAQDYLVKGEITGGVLDRTIRLSWERKRQDHLRKELAHESLHAIGVTADGEDPSLPLLRGHLKTIQKFLEELRIYTEKNSPGHLEALTLLEEKYGIEVVMRDVSAILRLSTSSSRPKKLSEHAQAVVQQATADVSSPMTEDEARQVVLDTLAGANE